MAAFGQFLLHTVTPFQASISSLLHYAPSSTLYQHSDNYESSDTPWMTSMPASRSMSISGDASYESHQPGSPSSTSNHITAPFSPSSSTLASRQQRSSVVIHRKSPLLVATPPQITRALAHSHPFLLPLSRLAGLLSWTTEDPWESFLLVCSFWATVLYGDTIIRFSGPVAFAAILILLMYLRRFSPLSSKGLTNEPPTPKTPTHSRSDSQQQHQKSLDEVVASLNIFTSRCQILLNPFLQLTAFLSTQSTATSATTRPALTALFWRILVVTPVWYLLTLPPIYLITTKRVVLILGTLLLTWHSRPARASRTILWRSKLVRRTLALMTGLEITAPPITSKSKAKAKQKSPPPLPARPKAKPSSSSLKASSNPASTIKAPNSKSTSTSDAEDDQEEPIHFTFTLYENQRRWLGIGWTSSLLAYERSPWTDESLNPTASKDAFTLPEPTDSSLARWRWAPDSQWRVEPPDSPDNSSRPESENTNTQDDADIEGDEEGWIYTDNKWRNPVPHDSWGRYTRRRKWVRDAELLDSAAAAPLETPRVDVTDDEGSVTTAVGEGDDGISAGTKSPLASPTSTPSEKTKGKSWFSRRKSSTRNRAGSGSGSLSGSGDGDPSIAMPSPKSVRGEGRPESIASASGLSTTTAGASEDDDGYVPLRFRFGGREGGEGAGWGVGEDVGMELG